LYPLAWAAEQVGGGRVDVEDLTPPGVEAHDTTLSAGQRADLQTADVLVILGRFGFQPDVERAAEDASGIVVAAAGTLPLAPSQQADLGFDPHVWLDPVLMESIVNEVADALVRADPEGTSGYRARERTTTDELAALDARYRTALAECAFSRFVTTHEAFGYLAAEYGLAQLGVEGLTPESEPSASRIEAAIQAIQAGAAAPAVFYEGTDEGRRVGESVAEDAGVSAYPLGTLESDPAPLDYQGAMQGNLDVLMRGLSCSG
jgi:zinc transport system substrate-binding protein